MVLSPGGRRCESIHCGVPRGQEMAHDYLSEVSARRSGERCSWRPRRVLAAATSRTPAQAPSAGGSAAAAGKTKPAKKKGTRSPETIEVLLQRVQARASVGDFRGAQVAAAEATEAYPDVMPAAYMHGAISLQLGEPEAGAPSLERALRLDPNDWRAAINLASCQLQLECFDDAIASAKIAVRLQPQYVGAHLVLAKALLAGGRPRAALPAAREALRLQKAGVAQPDGSTCESPLFTLGEVLVELDELAEAWKHAVEAAEASGQQGPQMALACTLAGRVQQKAGQHEQALAAYEKATKLDPSKPRANQLRTSMITTALRACLAPLPGDVFIATFPKSGTTWMQQVVCMLCGEPADVDIQMRAPYIEAAIATSAFTISALAAMY